MGKGSAGEEPSQVTGLLLLPLGNTETRGQDPVPPQGWHIIPVSSVTAPFPLLQTSRGIMSLLYLFSLHMSL